MRILNSCLFDVVSSFSCSRSNSNNYFFLNLCLALINFKIYVCYYHFSLTMLIALYICEGHLVDITNYTKHFTDWLWCFVRQWRLFAHSSNDKSGGKILKKKELLVLNIVVLISLKLCGQITLWSRRSSTKLKFYMRIC